MEKAMAVKAPSAMIEVALSQGADLEKLEKLLELQERWEANEARKEFVKAMADFKADSPEIKKIKHVKFTTQKGVTEFYHADLADVAEKINAKLSECGLSSGWITKQTNGTISVTCRITHVMGHSEETTLTASPDVSGSKNPIQAIGSAITYLERYTLLAITGLATKDMIDDDGQSAYVKFIDDKQLNTIVDLMTEKNMAESRMFKFMKVDTLSEILVSDYQKAIASIKATPKKEQPAEEG